MLALAFFPACFSTSPEPQDWWRPRSHTRDAKDAPDRPVSLEIGANAASMRVGRFYLGDHDDRWDDGARYELDFRYRVGLPGDLDPFVGGYLFHEKHTRDRGEAETDYQVTGLGVQLGAVLEPTAHEKESNLLISLMPYSRLGVGWQHGDFQNLPVDGGTTSGDFDRERFEGQVGADVRLTLLDRVVVNLGAGMDGWLSLPVEGETRNLAGQLVDDADRLRYLGWDAFVRLGLSLRF